MGLGGRVTERLFKRKNGDPTMRSLLSSNTISTLERKVSEEEMIKPHRHRGTRTERDVLSRRQVCSPWAGTLALGNNVPLAGLPLERHLLRHRGRASGKLTADFFTSQSIPLKVRP